ncbi:MAG: peptide deformylase [Saprospiraceae bacterium]|nr:MAG: peptide deformylase [Saprospiraceae bacterium]
MLLPILGYGYPVLKKMTEEVSPDYPDLKELIENMLETMYNASGVGLAAPQIGLSLRLFVIDTKQVMEEGKEEEGYKQAFINAHILEDGGEIWAYEEGCLSIPDVRGDVERPTQIRMRYQDENFETHEKVFTGMNARVIQHEYDHIEGILFTEHLKPIKRRLVKRKLENIRKGKVSVDYKMKFFGK